VALGGDSVAGEQVGGQATSDLAIAELIAFPLLALLSVLVFRGVAALLPVAIGGFSVLAAFAVLRAINSALSLSPFALNLVIGLGLGLAVDYSLFCVSRFREELGRGADVPEAIRTTMQTAGRTVMFSAVTVAGAMACLTVFPQRFLISAAWSSRSSPPSPRWSSCRRCSCSWDAVWARWRPEPREPGAGTASPGRSCVILAQSLH
jgi:RND superfamily putative drug exporter